MRGNIDVELVWERVKSLLDSAVTGDGDIGQFVYGCELGIVFDKRASFGIGEDISEFESDFVAQP